jgi:UDP-N-acetylmuramoyl-L-alanyl-D-glutamate--2,6-diaminopimelate ligase
MKLDILLKAVEALEVKGAVDHEITGIAYDSRRVKPGVLFVAVRGHETDGVRYVPEALAGGALAVVSESDIDLGTGVTHIRVPCARRALALLANVFYGDLSRQLKVIGITGTNGKTTTAYMIRDLLRAGGFHPGLLGTVAYEIGERALPASRTTPEAPDIHALFEQMAAAGCDHAVMEVSSHALALQRTEGIAFAVNVFTNLSRDHLDYHDDMESYFEVKARLFKAQTGDGAFVINRDCPWGRRLLEMPESRERAVSYGFDPAADVRASDVEMDVDRTRFRVTGPWGEGRVSLNLLGRFNVSNALAALAAGGLCGIGLDTMIRALEGIRAIPGRLEPVPNRKSRKVFVDYAHTDDALRHVLESLREICRGRLILVFGCGGNRDAGKRRLMGEAAAELADYSIITSDNPRMEDPGAIAGDIIEGFSGTDTFEVVLDRRAAIEKGLRQAGRRDILLIAGKGHETLQEIQGAIIPFDDRETVREILG